MDDRIKEDIDSINSKINERYSSIRIFYNNIYQFPELDPVRDEICKCILFDLNQAAITLTNHLLESALKKCLIHKYTIDKKYSNYIDSEDIYKEGISKFDNKKSDLSKSINAACSYGLISKEQKKSLHFFREKFRNSYSHASMEKTFGEFKLHGKIISSVNEIFKPIDSNIYVKNIPIIQGLVQSMKASNESLPYFSYVDQIVRNMLSNLKSIE